MADLSRMTPEQLIKLAEERRMLLTRPWAHVSVSAREAHPHYHKDVRHIEYVDVYRVLQLFNVTDPCVQHAVKKLLVAGGRGAGKDISRDIQEAIDSLHRYQEMQMEDAPLSTREPLQKV